MSVLYFWATSRIKVVRRLRGIFEFVFISNYSIVTRHWWNDLGTISPFLLYKVLLPPGYRQTLGKQFRTPLWSEQVRKPVTVIRPNDFIERFRSLWRTNMLCPLRTLLKSNEPRPSVAEVDGQCLKQRYYWRPRTHVHWRMKLKREGSQWMFMHSWWANNVFPDSC